MLDAMTLILMLAAQSASAQPAGKADAVIEALAGCGRMADDRERLACYDRTAGRVVQAQQAKEIVVLDRQDVRAAKRSLFGFSLPSLKLFGSGADDEPLKQIAGSLRTISALPGGRVRFELDDGSLWESIEEAAVPPRPRDVVTVKAGALGSYIATAPGRRALRVRRVR